MTQYNTTDQGPRQAPIGAGAESIDLLIRHLETAKQVFGSSGETQTEGGGELTAFPDVLCTLLYAQPGTFCPLLYVHIPTVTESVTESS
jgi:hypothetical protein